MKEKLEVPKIDLFKKTRNIVCNRQIWPFSFPQQLSISIDKTQNHSFDPLNSTIIIFIVHWY